MKYLKKYATEADYSAEKISIPTPNVVYVAETNKLYYNPEVGDIYAFTQESNPELMAFCYAQGWAAIPEAITYEECTAVTDIGTLFQNNTVITDLTDLKWFTGLASITHDAFYRMTAVTAIKIPEGVTTIGRGAFYGTSALKTVDCPSTITSYGKDLFSVSSSRTFISRAVIPPTLSQSSQWTFGSGTSVFKVPAASLEAYKAAENYTWLDTNNKFATIEE